MDYGEIDRQMTEHPTGEKLIQDMQLDVFEVTEEEVRAALASVYGGDELFALIKNAASAPSDLPTEDEYGSIKTALQRDGVQTWTLVVLSGLKQPGQELKIGILKRMLAAALPFGSEMAITVNDTVLASSKLDVQRLAEWVIGPSLGIGCVNLIWPTLMLSFGPPLVDRFPAPVAAEPSDARRAARFGRSVDRGWKSKA